VSEGLEREGRMRGNCGTRDIASQSHLAKMSSGERRMARLIAKCDGWRAVGLRFDPHFFYF
jgi:hypothetical protein